jgi:hypothetical protein
MCIPLSLLGNGSVNKFPQQQIPATIEELLDTPFSMGSMESKEILWVWLYIPLSLLGNVSANTFPLQQRTDGGVLLYMVHVLSEESRRLILPRTSCLFITFNSNPLNYSHILLAMGINSFIYNTNVPSHIHSMEQMQTHKKENE